MRTLRLLVPLAAFASIASTCPAQTAVVTIYAPGSVWKGSGRDAVTLGIGKDRSSPSIGYVFDAGEKLVLLTPGKYVTLQMPIGSHHLTTTPPGKDEKSVSTVDLDMKNSDHYFLRLTSTQSGAWVVQKATGHLEAVTCQKAREEADGAKPLPIRLVQKPVRNMLVDSTYFPRCD